MVSHDRRSLLLEAVQRRATWMVPGLNNLEYKARLKESNLTNLTNSRLQGDIISVYIYLHASFTSLHDTFIKDLHKDAWNHSIKLFKCLSNTEIRRHFFS